MIIKGQKLKGKEKEEKKKKEDMYARAVFCGFFWAPSGALAGCSDRAS